MTSTLRILFPADAAPLIEELREMKAAPRDAFYRDLAAGLLREGATVAVIVRQLSKAVRKHFPRATRTQREFLAQAYLLALDSTILIDLPEVFTEDQLVAHTKHLFHLFDLTCRAAPRKPATGGFRFAS